APFASHQLALLATQGFRSVVYCIAHLGDQIREYVGDGSKWNVAVTYSEEPELRGTAGALRLAADRGLLDDEFAVVYGDSYLPVDVAPIARAFTRDSRPVLMTVLRNDGRWDRSNVVYDDGTVLCYDKREQLPEMRYIDFGLSFVERDVVT